jgi:MFS family permease
VVADLYADILQSAQIPLYFVGGCLSFIAKDLGGAGKSVWLPVSNTLAIASVAPFTGYLQDIFGRRYIAIMGGLFIMVGIIIVGTAHTFGQGVVGMAIAGSGAAVTELTALAGCFSPPIVPDRWKAKRLQGPPSLCQSTVVACIWL